MLVLTTIKNSFVQLYNYLFKLVFYNLVWVTIFILPFLILYPFERLWMFYLAAVYYLLVTGPFILSFLHIIRRIKAREDTRLREFFQGIKTYFFRGLLSFFFVVLIYFVLFFDLYYFSQRADNIFIMIISAITMYIIVFFTMFQFYFWGLSVYEEDRGFKELIKRVFLLTMANPFSTLFFLIAFLLLTVLMVLSVFAIPLLFLVLGGLLINNYTELTLEKY
ncbi:hypothetical protein [Halocella sp. SP3-1]|uniref:hypothetical protein n=1 Tax=Halocella sp. SP3-1 TaxID=2382161 RepID=UPI000F74F264|nr:hypothetical protein [Halocella sp. SP3-1]AZO94116.1 hypothetical protein D7D81_05635 [Halocella sp. SP3-1]